MKKIMQKILLPLLLLGLCISCLPTVAFADAPSVEVRIPIRVTLGTVKPEAAETYQILLAADDAAYPMPEGSTGASYAAGIKGEGTTELVMRYDRMGIYTYTIRQKAGSDKTAKYDSAVYALTVTVTEKAGGKLEQMASLLKSGSDKKLDEASFLNTYTAPAPTVTPTPAPTTTPVPTATPTPTPTPAQPGRQVPPYVPAAPGQPNQPAVTAPREAAAPETIPEAEIPQAAPETIPETEIPLAAPAPETGRAWALVNLICTVLTGAIAIGMVYTYFKKDREKDPAMGRSESPAKKPAKFTGLIPAVGAVIAFLLTEDMRLPMAIVDKWTPLMVGILAANGILAYVTRKQKKEETAAV